MALAQVRTHDIGRKKKWFFFPTAPVCSQDSENLWHVTRDGSVAHTAPSRRGAKARRMPRIHVLTTYHHQELDLARPFGYQLPPPPVACAPQFSAPAAPRWPSAADGSPHYSGQMEGDGDDVPPTKFQLVTKFPGGQYYPAPA